MGKRREGRVTEGRKEGGKMFVFNVLLLLRSRRIFIIAFDRQVPQLLVTFCSGDNDRKCQETYLCRRNSWLSMLKRDLWCCHGINMRKCTGRGTSLSRILKEKMLFSGKFCVITFTRKATNGSSLSCKFWSFSSPS